MPELNHPIVGAPGRAFHIHIDIVFQIGIIFNFDDARKKMQLGRRISFDDLDFITDWFKNLQLKEPEPPMEKE